MINKHRMRSRSLKSGAPASAPGRRWSFGLLALLIFITLAACRPDGRRDHAHAEGARYTCPMHPQVVQDKPGNCPVCGMELVRITEGGQSSAHLMLTDNQMKLANITTAIVDRKTFGQTAIINGRLTTDERLSKVISSRAAGRIEKLFVKEAGQRIREGEPLYTLYSEDLLTLAQEYLLAKEQYEALGNTENRYKTFLDAAERKLLLIGRTRNQIRQLTRAGTPNARMTFLAPASGVVSEIAATDGQYVGEGTTLYRIDAVNTLWIEADLYANELSRVDIGDKISVRVAGADADRIGATVAFLSPEFQNNTQLTTLRASIDNSSGQLKPGQQAQVFLTHSSQEAIAIPSDAVIRDSRGSHVYVQSGRNSFRPQTVTTGLESFDQVEITEGLNPGDTVAVTGAYLLYSEMILKKGADPMAGHRH